MAAYDDPTLNGGDPNGSNPLDGPPQGSKLMTPWWQGPPPPGYPAGAKWPPPLPAGAHYGPIPGQIVGDNGGPIPNVTGSDFQPGGTYSVAPPATPPPGSGSGGGGSQLGGGIYSPWNTPFTPPSQLDLGGKPGLSFIPPAPSFDFTAPTPEQAAKDPGYQFTFGEGERAVEQGAAGRGLLNTSGSLRDLVNYGQAAATTQYNNVYNRAYSLAQSKFNPLMDQYHTLASAGQRQNELNFDESWQQYLQHYKEYTDWQNSDWQRKYQSASLQ